MTDQFDIQKALEADRKVIEDVRKSQEDVANSQKSQGEKLEAHAVSLKAIEESIADVREAIKQANRDAIASNAHNMAAEAKKEMNDFMRKGLNERKSFSSEKAFSAVNDGQGGFFVMPEIESGILDYARNMGAISGMAAQKTIGTKEWQKYVRATGMSATRIADDGATVKSDTPTYKKIAIPAYVASAKVPFGVETLADMELDAIGEMNAELAIAFAELLSSECINGSGVGAGKGLLSYDLVANSSYEFGKIGFVKSGASGDFAASNPADKLIDLQHALKRQYRSSAAFVMNDATLAALRMMKDGSGQYYLWQADATAGFGGRVLGSRIEIDDYMPDMAANSYSIAYGDIAQAYAVVRRAGLSLIRDPYTDDGKVLFKFRSRFGSGLVQSEAVKLMKFAA